MPLKQRLLTLTGVTLDKVLAAAFGSHAKQLQCRLLPVNDSYTVAPINLRFLPQ